jgi:hypothetical protein
MKQCRFRSLLMSAALLGVSAYAHAQVSLVLIGDVDVSGLAGIGSNPSAVAWNGTDAWVAGYNASGAAADTGIARISNALTAPAFGSVFGLFTTNNLRGLTALHVSGTTLFASLDNGSGNANSVRAFDITNETLLWRIGDNGGAGNTTIRAQGAAIDPGFNGSAPSAGNISFLSLGGGRKLTLNSATGAYIYSQSGGPAPNGLVLSGSSTTWRDLDFDPTNGDIYARESNRVFKATRTGDNTVTGYAQIGTQATASGVDNQRLAFVNSTAFGKFLLYNDRTAVGGGQVFSSVIKAISTTGTALTLDLGTFAPSTGVGAYDFAFDGGTQTLAVSDFTNRRVYVFGVGYAVSGTITLQGETNQARLVTLDFTLNGESQFTRTVRLRNDGTFTTFALPNPAGTPYVVKVSSPKRLRKNVQVDASAGGVTNVAVTLPSGDANGDNVIDITDLLALIGAYNAVSPDTAYLESADFNGDGINDITDLLLLIGNYNQMGD